MGEISEMMLDGTLCKECGCFIDNPEGYPKICAACEGAKAATTAFTKPKKRNMNRRQRARAWASRNARKSAQPEQEGKVNDSMPNPTPIDLVDPLFNAIWNVTKSWDVNVPEFYEGYAGINGSHVMLILNAIRLVQQPGRRTLGPIADSVIDGVEGDGA